MEQQKLKLGTALLAKQVEEADSRIAERISRAKENQVDVVLKQTKAELQMAQTKKLQSEADMTDLEFIRKKEGTDVQERLAEHDVKKQADIDKINAKAGAEMDREYVRQTMGKGQNNG